MRARGSLAIVAAIVASPIIGGCADACPEEALPGLCGADVRRAAGLGAIHDAVLLDLDGDGEEELIAAGGWWGALTVAWSDGRIESGELLGPHAAFAAIEAGDFDGDGRADVAVLRDGAAQVVLYTVDEAATFTELDRITIGGDLRGLWAGDLGGDGRDEVLVVDAEGGSLQVIDGVDRSVTGTPIGAAPVAFAVGDVDDDGLVDVVAADFLGAAFVVLRGVGDGTFADRETIAAGVGLSEVALGDLDGDGLVDIAGRGVSADEVWIRRGADPRGDARAVRSASDLAFGVGMAILEPEEGGAAGEGGVILPASDALRTWLVGASEDTPRGVRIGGEGLHASLFRAGDRWLTGGHAGAAVVEARRGPVFVERWWAPLPSEVAFFKVVIPGDFDGDGLVDVALLGWRPPPGGLWSAEVVTSFKGEIRTYFGAAPGGFVEGAPVVVEGIPVHGHYAAIDVDGDGRDDLVGVEWGDLWILRASDGGGPPFTVPEAAIELQGWAEHVVALRRPGGTYLIAYTPEMPGLQRVRIDAGGAAGEVVLRLPTLEVKQAQVIDLGDDAGESLVILGQEGAKQMIGAIVGDVPELGPIHRIAALTGFSADARTFELGAGALDEEGPQEVFLSAPEGLARIRSLVGEGPPEVEIEDLRLTLGGGRIVIADVDGDGDRDLLRVGDDVDEIVRGDGAGDLAGPPERVEIAADARAIVLPEDGGPPRALAIARRTLHEAALEVRRVARHGRRWDLPTGAGALLIADLRGVGRPSAVVVNGRGVAALIDPEEDERLAGWSSGESIVTAAAVVDFDDDGRDELLLALYPRRSLDEHGLGALLLLRWDGERWQSAPHPAPEGLATRGALTALHVRDLDGDLLPEMAVQIDDENLVRVLAVAAGHGSGFFAPLSVLGPTHGDQLTSGDVDGDERHELLVSGQFEGTLYWQRGGDIWSAEQLPTGVATLDGASLVTLDDGALWRQRAAAGELGARELLADDVEADDDAYLLSGDLDGDGAQDLVVVENYRKRLYLRRRGRLKAAGDVRSFGRGVALSDLDGGGLLDVVVSTSQGIEWVRGEER